MLIQKRNELNIFSTENQKEKTIEIMCLKQSKKNRELPKEDMNLYLTIDEENGIIQL